MGKSGLRVLEVYLRERLHYLLLSKQVRKLNDSPNEACNARLTFSDHVRGGRCGDRSDRNRRSKGMLGFFLVGTMDRRFPFLHEIRSCVVFDSTRSTAKIFLASCSKPFCS